MNPSAPMPEDIPLTCSVPEAWLAALDAYASAHNQSRQEVLRQAIAQLLALDTPPWQPQLDTLTKQVRSLHKRLKALEVQSLDISPVTAELMPSLPPAPPPPSLPAARRDRPFGAIRLDELSQIVPLNMSSIRHNAKTAGLSLYEAIEIETGWKYDPISHTFAPPL